MEKKVTIIKPRAKFWHLNLREVWDKKYLLWLFVKRDVTVQVKQTIFGLGWYFLSPLLSTLIYLVVFSKLTKLPTDGLPAPLFYLSGVCVWNYFSQCLTKVSTTYEANASLFGKVYFPRLIMPLSKIFSGLFRFGLQFSLFVVVYIVYAILGVDIHPTWYFLLFPLIILMIGAMALGVGLIVTSMTTKYKDLKNFFPVVISLWMYATPIIYPLSMIRNATLHRIMIFNPLTPILEAFKFGAFGVGEFSWLTLGYSFASILLLCLVGMLMYKKKERTFIDTI